MQPKDIRIIQSKLANLGLYSGKIDGDRGGATDAAIAQGLPQLGQPLPAGWQNWSDKRRAVAFIQAYALANGIDPGPIDGWWGPQTDYSAEALAQKLETNTLPNWRDITPGTANPNGWPKQSQVAAFYGPHGIKNQANPSYMVRVPSPWTFRIAWNLNDTRNFLWAHEKTAASVGRVLAQVFTQYGQDKIIELGLDIFSGDYNARLMKGSAKKWSMHSWAIAYDFDDTNNQLKWGADKARFAKPDYDAWWKIWESEGWVSLGRSRNYDWMHVQAALID